MNEKELMNKLEISSLIDEVSYNLDQKNLKKALEDFTEDARLNLIENGHAVYQLSGKEEIRETLTMQLEKTDSFFHNNGTKAIDVLAMDQNAVAATSCIVKMTMQTTVTDEDLYYHDKLIKVNGVWYIVERTVEIVSKSVR